MSPSKNKTAELKTWERDSTLNPRQLRAAGYVPATLYGKGLAPASIQVRAHEFYLSYAQGVRAFQVSGFVSGDVKIQEVQFPPVDRVPLAIQFWQPSEAKAKKGNQS